MRIDDHREMRAPLDDTEARARVEQLKDDVRRMLRAHCDSLDQGDTHLIQVSALAEVLVMISAERWPNDTPPELADRIRSLPWGTVAERVKR
jgi:hypothetical protein